jgi:hypothetical protein
MDSLDREEIELRLKAELIEAEKQLRDATPQQKAEARRRFRQALHNFKVLVVDGTTPLYVVPRKPQ